MRMIVGLVTGAALLIGGGAFAAQKLGQVEGARAPEILYAKTCGYCHGKNIGPVIRGRALPAASIRAIVRKGQNGMPSFRPTEITNRELGALAKWISTSKADPREKGL
jgi:mono/diheme cytochrome c family protein